MHAPKHSHVCSDLVRIFLQGAWHPRIHTLLPPGVAHGLSSLPSRKYPLIISSPAGRWPEACPRPGWVPANACSSPLLITRGGPPLPGRQQQSRASCLWNWRKNNHSREAAKVGCWGRQVRVGTQLGAPHPVSAHCPNPLVSRS